MSGRAYFATLGIRLLGGREFERTDAPGAPTVAIVNEEFSRRYFGGRSPVGSQLRFEREGQADVLTIVGMVANGKHHTLGEDQRAASTCRCANAEGLGVAFVVARTRGDASPFTAPVRRALGALDRSVSVNVEPMQSALKFALLPSRIGAVVLGSSVRSA